MLSLKSQSVMLDKITAHDQSSQHDTKAILDEGSTTEMYEYDLFCHEASVTSSYWLFVMLLWGCCFH
jgi:hypothetical protein